MKFELKNEFIFIWFLAALLAALAVTEASGPLRNALGLPFVLFFPGYALIAAIYPKKDGLDGIGRVALGFGLSIAVITLLGLMLNYTSRGLRLYPMLAAVLAFTAALSLVAVYRRKKLAPETRFMISVQFALPKWVAGSGLDRALRLGLIGAMLFTAGSLSYVVAAPRAGEKFTEFYILGPEGRAGGYITKINNGVQGEAALVVINHEYRPVTYSAVVRLGGKVISQHGPVELGHGEKWEEQVTFKALRPPKNLKAEFLLYKDGESQAYRSLQLWVNADE